MPSPFHVGSASCSFARDGGCKSHEHAVFWCALCNEADTRYPIGFKQQSDWESCCLILHAGLFIPWISERDRLQIQLKFPIRGPPSCDPCFWWAPRPLQHQHDPRSYEYCVCACVCVYYLLLLLHKHSLSVVPVHLISYSYNTLVSHSCTRVADTSTSYFSGLVRTCNTHDS